MTKGKEHPAAKYIREDYEPKFDRLSTTRRVLAHVTDDVDPVHGARNTLEALQSALVEDPNTHLSDPGEVEPELEQLLEAGLLKKLEDGKLKVTHDGMVELVN